MALWRKEGNVKQFQLRLTNVRQMEWITLLKVAIQIWFVLILVLVPVYSNTNQTLYQGDVGKKSP